MTPVDTVIAGTIVYAMTGFLALICILAWGGLWVAGAVDRHRERQHRREQAGTATQPQPYQACDDDGTGRCSGCAEIGDDTIAMLSRPAPPTADEVEQWVREWERDNRG